MKRNRKITLSLVAVLLILMGLASFALPTEAGDFSLSQSSSAFDSRDSFTSSDTGNNFVPPQRDFAPPSLVLLDGGDYFVHNQLLKLIMLLAFTAVASIIIVKRWYKYRKILLLTSVMIL